MKIKDIQFSVISGSRIWKIRAFILLASLFFFTTNAIAQSSIQVSGTVYGDNETLIGVSIKEQGSSNGTISDLDGNFSLSVKPNSVLEFSYLGYKTKTVNVGTNTKLNVTLESSATVLNEVVAIGYGVQQKKLITGATTQVKGEDIAKLNTTSALGALQSQTPGVNIVKASGKPGDGFKVTIRGLGTTGNSAPLYVIDGIVGGDIDLLNPADIESVDILKDGASAAIYGSRSANGVILVTTKQGKKGKTNIHYDGYFGWQSIAKKVTTLNAQQYIDILKEGEYATDADFAEKVPLWNKIKSGEFTGTDWLDEMTHNNAPLQNHSLNITGGNEASKYSIGFSYTSQSPLIRVENKDVESKYERYTVRINSDHELIKLRDFTLLEFGETLSLGYVDRNGLGMGTGNMYWNDVHNAIKASPLFPAYSDTRGFEWPVLLDPEATNPLEEMYYLRSNLNSKNYNARLGAHLILQPIKNLKFKTSIGISYNGWSSREYVPKYQFNERLYSQEPRISQGSGNGLQWLWDNTITYDFKLEDSHQFNVVIGSSLEKWGLGQDVNGQNTGFKFDSFEYAYLVNTGIVAAGSTSLTGAPWTEGNMASFFGRINYDYKGKYMASVVMRADGSSNFAKGQRWGYFPSISAGWNVAEEDFMQETRDYLDQLKLRVSWSENGNDRIPVGSYISSIAFGNADNAGWYYFGTDKGTQTVGSYPDIMANKYLKWETARQLNIGFDTRFYNNKLGFTFDWYEKKTLDWLVRPPALATIGTGAPYVNGGDVKNTGVEMSIDWNDRIGDFHYGVRANFALNKNEVTKIQGDKNYIEAGGSVLAHNTGAFYRAEVGKPIGYFYGYKTAGIFQNQEQIDAYINPKTGEKIMPNAKVGDVIFQDLNENGVIDNEDRTQIGNPHPDFTYGISFNIAYKGFDLAVTGYGVGGNQIAKSYRSSTDKPFDNYTTDVLGRWHGEGTSNRLPKLNGSSINWQYVSDLYIEDGDYFRISNLTLGYDFKRLFKSLPLSQLRVYGTIQNLYTFTNYSGMDPEVGYGGGTAWASGIDLGTYPSARTYMVGVSIKY